MRTTDPTPPANRAERRAAAKGKGRSTGQPVAPRVTGPKQRTKPVHVRTDFAARRSG